MFRVFVLASVAVACLFGHAFPTPVIQGPLRVRGNTLLDSNGLNIELNGANIGDGVAEKDNPLLFKVIRRRWNLNAVRIPVSVDTWTRDGEAYMSAVARSVDAANAAELAVVLVARQDATLPSASTITFWRAWADRFRFNNRVIFDVFDKPQTTSIPGRSGARRETAEWNFWLNGGTMTDGGAAVGMKQLVDTIRAAGASQVIAVQAFSDQFGFQGLDPAFYLPDANVIYEIHPYFNVAMTTAERDTKFGFLSSRLHLYAGEWGIPLQQDTESCRRIPRDINAATTLVYDTIRYFLEKRMSWTASTFEPGSLITGYDTYSNTKLDRTWACGERPEPAIGMGELLLLVTTGDPTGFGELLPELIANVATGTVGPLAPGEILAIYGVEIGPPFPGFSAELDEAGRLPFSVGNVEVLFDGVPSPMYYASAYQVNVQVPYSVAGKEATTMQLIYDGVPSSKISMPVVDASPGFFGSITKEARALNQDGSINSTGSPASPGSVVVLFGTGAGVLSPGKIGGHPAVEPLGVPTLPVSVRIGSVPAEVLYAGEAPGMIGILQVNVRIPAGPSGTRAVTRSVELTVGSYTAAAPVTIWVR